MLERLQAEPARSNVGRMCQTGCFVLAAAVVWLATDHISAVAAERGKAPVSASSCLDELVDVYLSPLLREEGPPIRIFLKPGPALVHLRLPRRRLRMEGPEGERPNTEDCGQKAFRGFRASYLRTSELARSLGISYDQPRVQDSQFFFYSLDPDPRLPLPHTPSPVDDSADREGMAGKGSWVVDPDYHGPKQHARFCLASPAPERQCYAAVEGWMVYDTGLTSLVAEAFMSATFGPPPDSLTTQITVADLDRYFAFLRRIAEAVVVAPASQAR